jgi:hypothetical protein
LQAIGAWLGCGYELAPLPGEQVAQLIMRTLSVPAAVRERAKLAFGR